MSDFTPQNSPRKLPAKPSINPTTKPKFKVTQTPFAPNITPAAGAESDGATVPKPRPAAPKPTGLKPSRLSKSEGSGSTSQPAKPAKNNPTPSAAPSPTSTIPPVDPEIIFDDRRDSSRGDLVAVGLQGIAAVAAIVFTVLAVLENLPFL
ncbi:MAG: hypothetical protein AAF212_12965 [Verrucomicrobiota bacterium]